MELVDMLHLGCSAARREGSTPSLSTVARSTRDRRQELPLHCNAHSPPNRMLALFAEQGVI